MPSSATCVLARVLVANWKLCLQLQKRKLFRFTWTQSACWCGSTRQRETFSFIL